MGDNEVRDTILQATLHYIDQLFESMNRLGTLANRIWLIQSVLSLVVLSLSAGVASTRQEIVVGGLGLRTSLSIFLTVGALLIAALAVLFSVVERHSLEFGREIERRYASIGYRVPQMRRRTANPLRGTSLFSVLPATFLGAQSNLEGKRRFGYLAVLFLLFLLAFVLPVGAEIAAGLKVSSLLARQGLGFVWTAFVVLAVSHVLISYRIAVYFQGLEPTGGKSGSRPN